MENPTIVHNCATLPQGPSQWCWAHAATAVSLHYPPSRYSRPCDLVNDELGAPDCNQPWYLDSALKRTGNLRSVAPRAALFDEIQREIDAGRPIGARIEWRDGSGHYVLIGGYGGTTQKVRVFDSLYGDSTADYLQFTVAYLGSGRWTDTYWTAPCQSLR